jgi:DNA polymerase III subunit alpha
VIGGNIRFGLEAVKGVGGAAVDAIIAAREAGGAFTSIWDFCERVDCRAVNKRAVECLVKSGALDSLGASRAGMLEVMPQAAGAGSKAQQDAMLGQGSIFDEPDPTTQSPFGKQHPPVPPMPDDRKQLNEWEKETLGLFLSSHPLKEVRPALRAKVECGLKDLAGKSDGEWVTVGGMIAECKRIRTKKGEPMMFATLDDLEGQVEMLVFNSSYASNESKIDMGKVLLVRGRVDHPERGATKLIAQEVEVFEPTDEEVEAARKQADVAPIRRRIVLQVDEAADAAFLEDLKHVVCGARGDYELWLKVGQRTLVLGEEFRVSPNCKHELAELAGVVKLAA